MSPSLQQCVLSLLLRQGRAALAHLLHPLQNELVVSASESGQVVLHKAGSTDLEGFLTRFSLPARSVRFDPRGRRAVVTSDEVIAKVIDVKDTTKVQLLTGHSRSIREASWSPDGQFVVRRSLYLPSGPPRGAC